MYIKMRYYSAFSTTFSKPDLDFYYMTLRRNEGTKFLIIRSSINSVFVSVAFEKDWYYANIFHNLFIQVSRHSFSGIAQNLTEKRCLFTWI